MTDMTTPIDALHAECIALTQAIRKEVNARRALVATWEPRPMPADYFIDDRFNNQRRTQ